jgi:copper chaperone CopZ
MRCTAVIHLRRRPTDPEVEVIEHALGEMSGILEVTVEPAEVMVTVAYDRDIAGLSDIVRIIEDASCPVIGVAQRRDDEAMAG